MVENLEKQLSESGSTFTKEFHLPYIAHVLNLAIQGGLKKLFIPSFTSVCSDSEADQECEEYEVEV